MRYLSQVIFLPVLVLWSAAAGSEPATPPDSDAGGWSLFDSQEIPNSSLKAFQKWTGMLARHRGEAQAAEASRSGRCKPNPRFPCPREEWQEFTAEARGMPRAEQIRATNHFMNRAPYIIDPINWGVADYWATPDEFLHRDGDCEDYAISKYLTLKALGVPPENMRVVVLHDENLDTTHAVLAVAFEGDILILDNQIRRVVEEARIHHYRPVYSINETGWWYHTGWRGAAQAGGSDDLPQGGFN